MQIQIRDFEAFSETSRQILVQRPRNRNNWISYCLGEFLKGNTGKALDIFDKLEEAIDISEVGYEQSELLLFKNMILRENGDLEKAIEHLEAVKEHIVDDVAWLETKARLLDASGKQDAASLAWVELVNINVECMDYHRNLRSCMIGDKTGDSLEASLDCLADIYDNLKEQNPKSIALSRVPLDFLTGEEFNKSLIPYLKKMLQKGVPSLFFDMKPLYSDKLKKIFIESTMLAFLANLIEVSKFELSDEHFQSPAAVIWVLLYLSRHFCHFGEISRALGYIEQAISHTPTAIDLYLAKAEILSINGEFELAFASADQARKLDLADRFLNTVCAKHAFAADRVEEAESIVSLFLREENSDSLINLYEMQCMWFEIDSGRAHIRRNELGKALKRLCAVKKHFEDIYEDQFDFHNYCVRKTTLSAYIETLRFEDKVFGHDYFIQSAKLIIQVYLWLNQMTKEEKEIFVQKTINKSSTKTLEKAEDLKGPKKSVDVRNYEEVDPDGFEMAMTSSPLEDAVPFAKKLEEFNESDIETHILCVQIHLARGKVFLALKSLKKCFEIDPQHPRSLFLLEKVSIFGKTHVFGDDNLKDLFESEMKEVNQGREHFSLLSTFREIGLYSLEHACCSILIHSLHKSPLADVVDSFSSISLDNETVEVCIM